MKRRNFLALLSASTLLGTTLRGAPEIYPIKEWDKSLTTFYKEPFFEFFQWFNGFPISEYQCLLYSEYIRGVKALTLPRKCGASTFLLTLAAWKSVEMDECRRFGSEAQFHKTPSECIFVSSNTRLSKIREEYLRDREKELDMKFHIKFFEESTVKNNSADCVINFSIFDCKPSSEPYNLKTFSLNTTEV